MQIPSLLNENWRIHGVNNLPDDWAACLRQLLSTATVIHSVVPVSPSKSYETLFALLKYGDSELIAETSFPHVIPAFRDPFMQRQENASEQPQESTEIPRKFNNIKTFVPDVWLAFKMHIPKLFYNIPTLT